MTIDNHVSLCGPIAEATGIEAPKKLYPETPVVCGGRKNAVVVTPDMSAYHQLGLQLAEKIAALTAGGGLPVRTDAQVKRCDIEKAHTIVLGSLSTNKWLLPLYVSGYTVVDDYFPGGDGYVVRSIHDPWGSGKNVLLLGGGSFEGVRRAVGAFTSKLTGDKDMIVGRTHRVAPGSDIARRLLGPERDDAYVQAETEKACMAIRQGVYGGAPGLIGKVGLCYGLTGDEAYAKLCKNLLFEMDAFAKSNPNTYGGIWGFDADFSLRETIVAWDLVEESFVFCDADRLRITRMLCQYIRWCAGNVHAVMDRDTVRHNHQTFAARGLLSAGNYYTKYYGTKEGRRWIEMAEVCFRPQMRASKVMEDCNGYQWHTFRHIIEYALEKPDVRFFDSGIARRIADYAILCSDNLGYGVAYGDTHDFQCSWAFLPFLRAAEWHYKDGRYQWMLQRAARLTSKSMVGQFNRKTLPVEPRDLLGVKAIGLDAMYYDYFKGIQHVPFDRAVDKVVMRHSFNSDTEYLLLDGLSNGYHGHEDGNSICRISDRGRIWLAGNDFKKGSARFHNGVLISNDGQSSKVPPFCSLEVAVDFKTVGFSSTTVENYAGVDWHRTIIWLKKNYFLIVDGMSARQPGNFAFNCKWHLLGKAALSAGGARVEQHGKMYFVKTVAGPRSKLTEDMSLIKSWGGYPYADRAVSVFEQYGRAELDKGGQYTFVNLLHGSDDARPADFRIIPVAPTAILVTGSGEQALAGTGGPAEHVEVGPIGVNAWGYRIGRQGFSLVGARQLVCGNVHLRSTRPIHIDCDGSRAVIFSRDAAHIVLENRGREVARCDVGPGRTEMDACVDLRPLSLALDTLVQAPPRVASRNQELQLSENQPTLVEKWSWPKVTNQGPPNFEGAKNSARQSGPRGLAAGYLTSVWAGDLIGTGEDMVVFTDASGWVRCLGPDGKLQWQFQAPQKLTCVTTADFDGDGRKAVVAGCRNGRVYALNSWGNLQWQFEPNPYKGESSFRTVFPAQLTGRAGQVIIAGADNWRYYAIDGLGAELWNYEAVHPATVGMAADIDQDGKDEIVTGTIWSQWSCVNPDGGRRWTYDSSKLGGRRLNAVAVGDLTGSGKQDVLFGGADAVIHAVAADAESIETDSEKHTASGARHVFAHRDAADTGPKHSGRSLWTYNTSDEVTAVETIDIDGDGRSEVIASSMSFNVYALGSDGKRRWRRELPDVVWDLALVDMHDNDQVQIAAACGDGSVYLISLAGELVARYAAGAAVWKLATVRFVGKGVTWLIALCADGSIRAFGKP